MALCDYIEHVSELKFRLKIKNPEYSGFFKELVLLHGARFNPHQKTTVLIYIEAP